MILYVIIIHHIHIDSTKWIIIKSFRRELLPVMNQLPKAICEANLRQVGLRHLGLLLLFGPVLRLCATVVVSPSDSRYHQV